MSSSTFDPNLSNNTATIDTPVVGGALVKLTWTQPQPSAGNPTPAPSDLGSQPAGALSASSSAFASTL